jgi:hypothetical protein
MNILGRLSHRKITDIQDALGALKRGSYEANELLINRQRYMKYATDSMQHIGKILNCKCVI